MVALLAPCLLGAAKPRLALTTDGAPVGDGQTPIRVRIAAQPAAFADSLREVRAHTDAGRVGTPEKAPEISDSSFVVELVPPRVAATTTITITVDARAGEPGREQSVSGSLRIDVEPPPEPPSETVTGGVHDLRVSPARLLLGKGAQAEVSVRGDPASPPRAVVSIGELSAWKAGEDGRLHATYHPPAAGYPRLVLIAVFSGRGAGGVDWTGLPLLGRGVVETKTEPNARVEVRVGDNRYGPFRTDAKGTVEVPIIAAPGVPTGTTTTYDDLGNRKDVEVDLRAPPFNRLLTLCPEDSYRVRTFVLTPRGEPDRNARLSIEASSGEIGKPGEVAPGAYEAVFQPHDAMRVGDAAQITTALSGDATSEGGCTITLRGGEPASVDVALSQARYLAGGGLPVLVTIAVVDDEGRPARRAPLALEVDFGSVSPPTLIDAGTYTASWRIQDRFAGRREAELHANIDIASNGTGTPLAQTATIGLEPGSVTSFALDTAERELLADGESPTQLRVRPIDRFQNLAPHGELAIHAQGQVGPLDDKDGDGTLEATYIAPLSYDATEDVIEVTEVSGVSASLALGLVPLRRRWRVGGKLGFTTNFVAVNAPVLFVEGGYRLPVLDGGLEIVVEAGASVSPSTRPVAGTDLSATVTLWSAPLLGWLTYELRITPVWTAYFGAGGGLTLAGATIRGEGIRPSGGEDPLGAGGAVGGRGGADVRLGPGRLLFEVSYVHAEVATDGLSGNAGGLFTLAGYRLEL